MTDQPSYAAEAAFDPVDADDADDPARVSSALVDSSESSDLAVGAQAPDQLGQPDQVEPSGSSDELDQDAADPDTTDVVGRPGSGGGPAPEPTGVPEVDALRSVLEDLDVLPIEDHAQVFAEAHQRLHETLLSADEE